MTTWSRTAWRPKSPSCRAGLVRLPAGGGRRVASRPIRRRWPRSACRWTICAPPSPPPTSTSAKGSFDGRCAPPPSTPTTSSSSAAEYAALVVAYRTARRCAWPTLPTSWTAPRTRAWPPGTADRAVILNIQRQPAPTSSRRRRPRQAALLPQLTAPACRPRIDVAS